jgi:two-component system chemotaxis response regulator CheB
VAEHAGTSGVGVLLTGMGDDGAEGLLAIKGKGGRTFAQDEASCAVFGMPRAAHVLGAVRDLLPLDQLAAAIRRGVAEIRG